MFHDVQSLLLSFENLRLKRKILLIHLLQFFSLSNCKTAELKHASGLKWYFVSQADYSKGHQSPYLLLTSNDRDQFECLQNFQGIFQYGSIKCFGQDLSFSERVHENFKTKQEKANEEEPNCHWVKD